MSTEQVFIERLGKALRSQPGDAGLWRARGMAKIRMGQYKEAFKDCDKAIQLKSDDADNWVCRGISLVFLKKDEEALKDFQRAIKLESDNDIAWNFSGIAKLRPGKHSEAIKDFDRAIELKSDYAVAWCNRGVARVMLAKNGQPSNLEQARFDLKKALALSRAQEDEEGEERAQNWLQELAQQKSNTPTPPPRTKKAPNRSRQKVKEMA